MQAARGAPLTPSGTAASSQAPRRRRLRWLFAGIALAALVVDQWTKQWALEALADRSIPVVGDFLTFHLVLNPGAAFGTGTGVTWLFSCLALVAMVVVLWLSRRLGSPLWALGMGLLFGGVAGNFTDRLFREPGPMRGHVVDFLMLPNWPVFNVADMCINVAAAVIVIQTFRGVRLDGGQDEASEPSSEHDGEPGREGASEDPREGPEEAS